MSKRTNQATRRMQNQQAAAMQEGKEQERKPFTVAERDELIERANAVQEAVEHQNKWIAWLRKQHDAAEGDGWGIEIGGFVREPKPAQPPAAEPPASTSTKGKAKAAPAMDSIANGDAQADPVPVEEKVTA